MDAAELEAALISMLARYDDRLERAHIYGIEVLHRPGAKAHDWFAGVRPGTGSAKLMLLTVKDHPELLASASPALRKRKSGDALFTLKPGDERLLPEFEALLARAFERYQEGAEG
jgi:hypothetical protein